MMAIGSLVLNRHPCTRTELFQPLGGDKTMHKEAMVRRWQLAFLDELVRLKYIGTSVEQEGGGTRYNAANIPQLARLLGEYRRDLDGRPTFVIGKGANQHALDKIIDEDAAPSGPGNPTIQQLLWPNDRPPPAAVVDISADDAEEIESGHAHRLVGLARAPTETGDDKADMLDVLQQILSLMNDQGEFTKRMVHKFGDIITHTAELGELMRPFESTLGTINKRLNDLGRKVDEQSAGAVGQKLQATLAQVTLELSALKGPVQTLASQISAADVETRLSVMEAEIRALRESNEALAQALRASQEDRVPKLARRLETFAEEMKSLSELALEAIPTTNSGSGA